MSYKHLQIVFTTVFMLISVMIVAQPANQVQLVSNPTDRAYDRAHIDDMKPIPYPYLRESDVFWEKRVWRVIDFREKINQSLYFPERPQGRWRSLMQVLWDVILSGEVTAYSYDPSTDNFEELIPMTANQIEKELADTLYVETADPNDPNQVITKKVVNPFNPQDVQRMRVKEDWIFDKQRSEMQVRIIGICPVREDRDPQTGEFRGYEPLFWLYFPEIRPFLARYEVFNRHNSANRLSYDQLFLQRRFGSYIIKEDNVFDRYIGDYATGVDALLEAERVKEEIRDFEGELWVY
ncbi:MAG: gliding motility protein GldN [Bacteroidota bacterium]